MIAASQSMDWLRKSQGAKMNVWNDEKTAEYNRQRIAEEIHQIRLERLAMQSSSYRPSFFGRTMFNFANWMIATGKQLRKRYEIPAQCSKTPTGSFAQ
jgi:hypothetical protein